MTLSEKSCFLALVIALALPTAAQARILPLDRAFPHGAVSWGYADGVVPQGGDFSSNEAPLGSPFEQVTFAYDTVRRELLVGCRGFGRTRVRVWLPRYQNRRTGRHGFRQLDCDGTQPWRVVFRGITPANVVEGKVTFEQ